MNKPANRIRKANVDDAPAIMTVLEKLSDEIPVKMDTEERREALRENVAECCEQSSWVALDETAHVVGFLLGKKFRYLLPGCEFEGFTLPYGGVLKCYRKKGQFLRLLSKAKALKRPLQVDVSRENKSGMADRLIKEGFVKKPCSRYPNQDYFVWLPESRPHV